MLIPHYSIFEPVKGKKKLTAKFDIEYGQVITDFLLFDVSAFNEKIKSLFDMVLLGDVSNQEITANICHIVVGKEYTTLTDLTCDVSCTVNTRELYLVILEWSEKQKSLEVV